MRITKRIFHKSIYTFLLLFGFISALHCQPDERPQFPFKMNLVTLETNCFPSDTGYTCYISYRIPYNNLIFVKNNHGFTSGLALNFEMKKENRIVNRKSASKNVEVEDYISTISTTAYLQGEISIELGNGDYILHTFVSLKNGDSSIPLDSIVLKHDNFTKNIFIKPVVIEEDKSYCTKNIRYRLVNFQNTIPFSTRPAELLIPVRDTSVQEISVKIDQQKETMIERKCKAIYAGSLSFKDCDGQIVLEPNNNGSKMKYFLLPNFKEKFKEGPITIFVSDGNYSADFKMSVSWNDKPKTLINPEIAIKILRAIEKDAVVDSLLSFDKEEYGKVLTEFWAKKYPSKNGAFNQIEAEFYRRADYAIEKYTSVANKNGTISDRGITYIRYGEPDEVKRDYNDSGMALEIWIYKRISKQFVFTDKTGLGSFTLEP